MKKLLIALLVLITAVLSCAGGPALGDMLPVGQLPTSEAWTETVDTIHGPVQVDLTISLPDIAKLPVYEVAYRTFTEEELHAAFPHVAVRADGNGSLIFRGDLVAQVYPIPADQCTWMLDWPSDSDYAEGAPESGQDVERRFAEQWRSLYGGQTALWTRGIFTHSRTWRKDRLGEPVEPVNEHGYYDFYLELALDGVTVYDNLFFERDRPGDMGPHAEAALLTYYDENNFHLTLKDLDVLRTVAEDVPILPLEEIKAVLRQLIATGHLREIYRMELCYLLMWSDTRNSIITVPAWVVHGEYHDNASAPDYEDTDDRYLRVMGGMPLIIPAQTGKLIDYASADPNRWLASTYLTER